MSQPTLLLFDIDGTLLSTNGVGRAATNAVFERHFGAGFSADGVPFSGKTDPQIFAEVMEANGLPQDANRLGSILNDYQQAMRETLTPERVTLLPGVHELILRLNDDDRFVLGLLTGNVEPMAYFKLQQVGLDAYFGFGAFGSDDADRYRLPPVAQAKAQAHTGHRFEDRAIVIIGDTEHDLRCGRGIGARSVGVCTGHYGRADLMPHGPDLLLDDLTDHQQLIDWAVR